MSNEVNSSNIDANIQTVVKKKKKVLPIILGIVGGVLGLIFVVVTIIVAFSVGKAGRLQEQLDLGQKYLNELNYEQAIASYEQAIEIDSKSTEAYIGLANVYKSLGDFNSAMSTLQRGYDTVLGGLDFTGGYDIYHEISELEKIINGEVIYDPSMNGGEVVYDTSLNGGSSSSGYMGTHKEVVSSYIVEGYEYSAYYEYVLSEESTGYLNDLIGKVENGSANQNDYDAQKAVDILKDTGNFTQGMDGSINIAHNGYKIYIKYSAWDTQTMMLVIPIDSGVGYAFYSDGYENGTKVVSYFCGECQQGTFWGPFNGTSDENGLVYSISGSMKNGLLEGDFSKVSEERSFYMSFTDGSIDYSNIEAINEYGTEITVGTEVDVFGESRDIVWEYYVGSYDDTVKALEDEKYSVEFPLREAQAHIEYYSMYDKYVFGW